MTFQENIAALKHRIDQAETQRDAWLAAGLQEKHLEACSMVDALELQLDRLIRIGPAADAGSELPPTLSESARLMAELGITYNGRTYRYDQYRYDRLGDAVSYARLQRARQGAEALASAAPVEAYFAPPDEGQQRLMASLAITFEEGIYRLGPYRYDRLADAVNYARVRAAASG